MEDKFAAGWERVKAEQRRIIDEHGVAIMAIFPTKDDPPDTVSFCYTNGRAEKGRPELLITGPLGHETMHAILMNIVEMDDSEPVPVNTRIAGIIGTEDGSKVYDVILLPCDSEASEMNVTRDMQGTDFEALQVVWPDDLNRFPWEDWTIPDKHQPLFLKEAPTSV